MTLIFIGGPGSGKDTQISLLKEAGFDVISTGDISRKKQAEDPKVRELVSSGHLIDDITITSWLKEAFEVEKSNNIILNGFPRNNNQAEVLESMLKDLGRELSAVIYLKVSGDILFERLNNRYVCLDCGKIFIAETSTCPSCSGKVVKREDDKPEVIRNRIEIFENETLPLVEYYKNRGILIEVNGEKTIPDIASEIKEKISDLN